MTTKKKIKKCSNNTYRVHAMQGYVATTANNKPEKRMTIK